MTIAIDKEAIKKKYIAERDKRYAQMVTASIFKSPANSPTTSKILIRHFKNANRSRTMFKLRLLAVVLLAS